MRTLRVSRLIALPALLILGGCASAGHPCFSERVMFPDKSVSCQYGRTYQCDNGDWIAARRSCTAAAPEVAAAAPIGNCEFAGVSYASGAASCNSGMQYRCENGRWRSLDTACSVSASPYQLVPRGNGCSYQGATVASSSAICQSGTTFLCNNGQWINLGTACG